MPEVKHPVLSTVKAVSKNHVSAPSHDRGEQNRIILRIVLKVGVLNQHQVARDLCESSADRESLSVILVVEQDAHAAGISVLEASEDFARAIAREVVDDDDLLLQGNVHLEHGGDNVLDRIPLIKNRNDDRELRRRTVDRWRQAMVLAAFNPVLLRSASATGYTASRTMRGSMGCR